MRSTRQAIFRPASATVQFLRTQVAFNSIAQIRFSAHLRATRIVSSVIKCKSFSAVPNIAMHLSRFRKPRYLPE